VIRVIRYPLLRLLAYIVGSGSNRGNLLYVIRRVGKLNLLVSDNPTIPVILSLFCEESDYQCSDPSLRSGWQRPTPFSPSPEGVRHKRLTFWVILLCTHCLLGGLGSWSLKSFPRSYLRAEDSDNEYIETLSWASPGGSWRAQRDWWGSFIHPHPPCGHLPPGGRPSM